MSGISQTVSTADLIAANKLSIGDGYRAKNSELANDGVPFARAGNINGGFDFEGADLFPSNSLHKVGEKISLAGDVVFTSKGTVGRFAYVREETPAFVYSPQLCYWRSLDPESIDSRWLFYWMQGQEFWRQVRGLKGQTDMADYVSLRDQRQMNITLPTIDEQRRIASILGSLDDTIEHNRRTALALERLASAIFKAWFVDFEPVKAKAEGATSFPSMPQEVFYALPTTFVDTEIGPVPEGWGVKALSEAFEINPKRTLKKGEVAPYLGMTDMPTTGYAPESWTHREYGSGMRFMNGDTLVARITPCLENGKTAYVDFLDDGEVAWGSTEYIVLRPKKPLPNILAYFLARSRDFREFAIQNMTGTSGRQRVSASAFDHYLIAISDAATAHGFNESMEPMFEWIRASMKENSKILLLRDYLLPVVMGSRQCA